MSYLNPLFFNEYIVKCNSCSKNDSENFVQECISLFKNEIPNITEGLDMYNNAHLFDVLSSQNKNVDCSNDVKLLRKKFLNYKYIFIIQKNQKTVIHRL